MHWRLLSGIVGCGLVAGFAYGVVTSTVGPPSQAARSGVVRDAHTRQAVAGAYVVARWLEQDAPTWGLGDLRGRCVFRVITQADAQGRFVIPDTHADFAPPRSWSPARSRTYFRELHAYAPGYISMPRAVAADDVQGESMILMSKDAGSAQEHVSALRDTLADFACTPQFPQPAPIAPLVYAEAYAAACLPEPNAAAVELSDLQALRFDEPSRGNEAGTDSANCAHLRQASSASP